MSQETSKQIIKHEKQLGEIENLLYFSLLGKHINREDYEEACDHIASLQTGLRELRLKLITKHEILH